MNDKLIIMAGGASSRMKRTLEEVSLSETTLEVAQQTHKSLIPLGQSGKPLLFYLIRNAAKAAYRDIYIITSPKNEAFKRMIGDKNQDNDYAGVKVHFVVQHTPLDREKPLGTADALLQAMDQYPELKTAYFTVCNGDNLYSVKALRLLNDQREVPNALISYSRSGLQFDDERISKFAVMEISQKGNLITIIEKPDPAIVEKYRDTSGEIRVSMNIFSFYGKAIYAQLEKCPIHPERNEKELPEAVRRLVIEYPNSVQCFPLSEHLPDLTAAQDIALFENINE